MKNMLLIALALMMLTPIRAQKGRENDPSRNKIPFTGTYLATQPDAAHILQLSADGNMTFIMSWQFDNEGVVDESYSNTKGNWKVSGPMAVTASAADIAFKNGAFIGVAHARYQIQFEKGYRTASLTCSGALYPPGVSPLDKNAAPVAGSTFTCGALIRLERLPTE
ncbi:MAG: hypothetical protein KDD01_06130 [Phaeodactylibacter sp.]|nr:hypothetical protein [Phaeodactylibacter sp.]